MWFRKAADQGDAEAQVAVGCIYGQGADVPKDEKEAAKWFRKAAEQGDATAQYNLASMLVAGEDFVTAHAWYDIAADHGRSDGLDAKNRIASVKQMTPEQIAEAQELSKKLLKQIEENKKKAK
jgi:hypothetical protein